MLLGSWFSWSPSWLRASCSLKAVMVLAWSCAQSSPSGTSRDTAWGPCGELVPRPALTSPRWAGLGSAALCSESFDPCWHLLGFGFPLALPCWGLRAGVFWVPVLKVMGTWISPWSWSHQAPYFETFSPAAAPSDKDWSFPWLKLSFISFLVYCLWLQG